jgi:hypothetical protein
MEALAPVPHRPRPGLLISRRPSPTLAEASCFVGSDCAQEGLPDVAISPDVVSFIHRRFERRDLLQRCPVDNVARKAASVGCQWPQNETINRHWDG